MMEAKVIGVKEIGPKEIEIKLTVEEAVLLVNTIGGLPTSLNLGGLWNKLLIQVKEQAGQ
jgi:hypothetical protein